MQQVAAALIQVSETLRQREDLQGGEGQGQVLYQLAACSLQQVVRSCRC